MNNNLLVVLDDEERRNKTAKHVGKTDTTRTLKQKQQANGRTLALNGKAWATLRECVLNEQPLCEHCLDDYDKLTPASEVDHVDNDPTNNRRQNLSSLCKPCHSRKTNAEMGHRVTWGCDANGTPRDPRHPWNLEKSPPPEADEPHGETHLSANGINQP